MSPGAGDSDEELMARFCRGDEAAFDGLFRRHAPAIQRYLARLAGDGAADDLLQATFLSVVRGRGRYLGGTRFRPWLYAIATNAARDLHRRRRPEDVTATGALPDAAADEGPARDAALERRVRAALEALPLNQREVILLNRFEGMSMAEVAEAVGASEAAVKVRAHRGYLRLREDLRGVWEEGS